LQHSLPYDLQTTAKFIIDEVASFSVTESRSADDMTKVILAHHPRGTAGQQMADLTILDGMSCVGGNTISFCQRFKNVLSNELDEGRFGILKVSLPCIFIVHAAAN